MRRALPALAMITLLAVPLAGCSGHVKAADPVAASSAGADSSTPGEDATRTLHGGAVPGSSAAATEVASTQVGKMMTRIGCTQPKLMATDPLSTQTGMCKLTGGIVVATFATNDKRDAWIHQELSAGMTATEGPWWAVAIEVRSDVPTVLSKLAGA